jgi:replicative DNA helicase
MSTLKQVSRFSDVFLDRPMPSSVDNERTILGCIILDNSLMEQAALLSEDEFYTPSHKIIFAAMKRIWKTGIDPLTLQEELRRTLDLERIGGAAYIASLFDGVPRFSRIEAYVKIVRQKAQLRKLISIGYEAVMRAFDDEDSTEFQIAEIERELSGVCDDGESSWQSAGAVFSDYIAEVESRMNSDRPVVGFSTGFHGIDRMTLGLERKFHTVIGARPGVGKTAFGLSLTLYASLSKWNVREDGKPPLIVWFSMEMPAKQLMRRMVAILADVDALELHRGNLSPDEWRRVHYSEEIVAKMRVHFDDRCGLSVAKIRQAIRVIKQAEGQMPDMVFTDYLQLGDGEKGRGTRAEEVARFCKGMTELFKENDICGVSLAQLNRDAHGNKPSLRDFKESGQIEQDAALVFGLHRPEIDNPTAEPQHSAELIILKQRNGPMGSLLVGFKPDRAWFYEADRTPEQWQQMIQSFKLRT